MTDHTVLFLILLHITYMNGLLTMWFLDRK